MANLRLDSTIYNRAILWLIISLHLPQRGDFNSDYRRNKKPIAPPPSTAQKPQNSGSCGTVPNMLIMVIGNIATVIPTSDKNHTAPTLRKTFCV